MIRQKRAKSTRKGARGFTLVEAIMTLMLLGIGLSAVLGAVNLGIRYSGEGAELTQGVFLAQEVREMTLNMDFLDVADLDGNAYSPPVNSHGESISGMSGWSQAITTSYRSSNDPSAVVPSGTSDLVFVEVQVTFKGASCLTTGWLVARKE